MSSSLNVHLNYQDVSHHTTNSENTTCDTIKVISLLETNITNQRITIYADQKGSVHGYLDGKKINLTGIPRKIDLQKHIIKQARNLLASNVYFKIQQNNTIDVCPRLRGGMYSCFSGMSACDNDYDYDSYDTSNDNSSSSSYRPSSPPYSSTPVINALTQFKTNTHTIEELISNTEATIQPDKDIRIYCLRQIQAKIISLVESEEDKQLINKLIIALKNAEKDSSALVRSTLTNLMKELSQNLNYFQITTHTQQELVSAIQSNTNPEIRKLAARMCYKEAFKNGKKIVRSILDVFQEANIKEKDPDVRRPLQLFIEDLAVRYSALSNSDSEVNLEGSSTSSNTRSQYNHYCLAKGYSETVTHHLTQGIRMMDKGQKRFAIKCFQAALETMPQCIEAQENLRILQSR